MPMPMPLPTSPLRPARLALAAVLAALLGMPVAPAMAQISLGIALPGLSIGFNLPGYPRMVPVPGQPVYYAPSVNANYFFHDDLYWLFQDDRWYSSAWFNGPWNGVEPTAVPVYVLRVPVRYYRRAPDYFRGWAPAAPPRWGDRWGSDWTASRNGWDQPGRSAVPARRPLPSYQQRYSGSQYPHLPEEQRALQTQHDRRNDRPTGRNMELEPEDEHGNGRDNNRGNNRDNNGRK